MTIFEKIRQQRKSLNISQEELSNLIGVSLKTIQRWESGERSPRMKEVQKISQALGIPLGEFLNDSSLGMPPVTIKATTENTTQAKNMNMASITLDNGRRVEAPATPEGLAFLKEVFAMSLGNGGVMKGVTA